MPVIGKAQILEIQSADALAIDRIGVRPRGGILVGGAVEGVVVPWCNPLTLQPE